MCPAETRVSPSASYVADDLRKVVAVHSDTTLDSELNRIRGKLREHPATMAYGLRDVVLIHGSLYSGAMKHRLVRSRRHFIGPDVPKVAEEAVIACTLYGSIYFGHWMTDDLTLHLAAESMGLPVTVERKLYDHESEYCRFFGVAQNWMSSGLFKTLVILDDVGQNRYKRQRYQELRARIRASAAFSPTVNGPTSGPISAAGKGGSRVYVRRGAKAASTNLTMINANEVEAFLASQGFAIVDTDHDPAWRIAEKMLEARLVVGIEGSQMAHALWSIREGGGVCMLQPPQRFNNVFKEYTDCLDLKYGFAVGDSAPGGFRINISALERVLELMDRQST